MENRDPAIILMGDMTRSDVPMLRYVDSVFAALQPEHSPFTEVDGEHVLVANKASALIRQLDSWIRTTVPQGARVISSSWDFCFTHEQVDQWEMPHDCNECRDSVRQAHEQIDKGLWVAFATLQCEEPVSWTAQMKQPCSCGEMQVNIHETITTDDGICHRPVAVGPCFVKDYEG